MVEGRDSEPPESAPPSGPGRESRRRRLEGVIPEILKRAVELGVEKAQEAPDNLKQFAADLKLPKEIASYLLTQIDETKNGVFRVVAKEMREFLEHTNFAGEIQKLLTTVQFEVNTTIRFTPNDGRSKAQKAKAKASTEGGDAPAQAPGEEATEDAPLSEDGEGAERGTPLPIPEVKTAVHMRRDERERRRRPRDAG